MIKPAAAFAGALMIACAVQAQAGAAPDTAPATVSAPAVVAPLLDKLSLHSSSVFVVDEDTGETIVAKNVDAVVPVASLTKLMTALVVVDASLPGDEMLEITSDDVDREKHQPSRLRVGTTLSRKDLLLLALMASENRAASALSRNYPGGRPAFLDAMNAKAVALGMKDSHFADPAGLSSRSVSSARDLRLLLAAANRQPTIRDYSTRPDHSVRVGKRSLKFINSNRLVRRAGWGIELQKTGYTNEAGRCLVMRVTVAGRRLAMIFLNSVGKLTRYGDASRVRQRLEHENRKRQRRVATAAEPA